MTTQHSLFLLIGLALISALALAAALVAQYGFGLAPCPLCVLQRWPYALAVAAGLLLLWPAARRAPWLALLLVLMLLLFLAGAALALYHVGVEQAWWASAVCDSARTSAGNAANLTQQLLATPPQPSCANVSWSLFGLSITFYNLALSVLLALAAALGAAYSQLLPDPALSTPDPATPDSTTTTTHAPTH